MAVKTKIILSRLAYTVYQHADFESFRSFAKDFGFEQVGAFDSAVFFRGYGKDPFCYRAQQAPSGEPKAFVGAGFVARSQQDFDSACRLEGATVIDVSKWPGGGRMVRIKDPNGFFLEVVHGQTERNPPAHGISAVTAGHASNGALDKNRKGWLPEPSHCKQHTYWQ